MIKKEKTKEELIAEVWIEYNKKRKPIDDEWMKTYKNIEEKEEILWKKYYKKKKEIEKKFKGKC